MPQYKKMTPKQFIAALDKYEKQMINTVERVVQETAVGVQEELVKNSAVAIPELWTSFDPTGYEPGTYISNWQVGINNVPNGVVANAGESGSNSIAQARSAVRGYEIGDDISLVNNTPYAADLETGEDGAFSYEWLMRGQDGVIEPTMLNILDILQDVINITD